MTQEEMRRLTREEIGQRIREGVKAIIEKVLENDRPPGRAERPLHPGPHHAGGQDRAAPGTR
jgi:hypothetical protein